MTSKAAVKFDDGKIQVDPQQLFQRLSIIATGGRFENPKSLFKYPPALFDTSLLPRKANKPALAATIWTDVKNTSTEVTGNVHFVLDGGALIHRVSWPRSFTYDAIYSVYVQYVIQRYGKATVVFDGYQNGPSTKDCTHQRRTSLSTPTVAFDSSMVAKVKKEEFLANKVNKQKFILHLGERLQQSGCTVNRAAGDAGLLIAQTAIQSARSLSTVLVGDDTDLLVLLCFYAEMDAHDLFFRPEPKQSSKTKRVWNIKETKNLLGPSVCKNILFVHALLGCDTTSSIYGIGKGVALHKIKRDELFREQADVF